jgi:hypothetical protein
MFDKYGILEYPEFSSNLPFSCLGCTGRVELEEEHPVRRGIRAVIFAFYLVFLRGLRSIPWRLDFRIRFWTQECMDGKLTLHLLFSWTY